MDGDAVPLSCASCAPLRLSSRDPRASTPDALQLSRCGTTRERAAECRTVDSAHIVHIVHIVHVACLTRLAVFAFHACHRFPLRPSRVAPLAATRSVEGSARLPSAVHCSRVAIGTRVHFTSRDGDALEPIGALSQSTTVITRNPQSHIHLVSCRPEDTVLRSATFCSVWRCVA